jgi:hypothetical protein
MKSAAILKVHDPENLLHRVLLEPASLIGDPLARIVPGQSVEVEGALTRDDAGKLLIASVLVRDEETLALRDSAGAIRVDALAEPYQSALRLTDLTLITTDGDVFGITGWILDRARGTAVHVCVDVDGTERAVAWEDLERSTDSTWPTVHDSAELANLPEVTEQGALIGEL